MMAGPGSHREIYPPQDLLERQHWEAQAIQEIFGLHQGKFCGGDVGLTS